jgi:ribonuclease T1
MAKKRPRSVPSTPATPPRSTPAFGWARLVRLVLIFGLVAYLMYRQQPEPEVPPPLQNRVQVEVQVEEPRPRDTPADTSATPASSSPAPVEIAPLRKVVPNQTIRDRSGDVVFQGDVDLADTLARIARNETLPQFENDGSVFQNRERRLPERPRGYYREWVHPTPAAPGPGGQRIVSGEQGDYWYTPDHYQTFLPLRGSAGNE